MTDRRSGTPACRWEAQPYRLSHREEVKAIVGRTGLFAPRTVDAFLSDLDACALSEHGGNRCALVVQYTRYEPAVGIAVTRKVPDQQGKWFLSTLIIDPPHRRRGFGRELLQASERFVSNLGAMEIEVELPGRWRTAVNMAFLGTYGYRLRSTATLTHGQATWYYKRDSSGKEACA